MGAYWLNFGSFKYLLFKLKKMNNKVLITAGVVFGLIAVYSYMRINNKGITITLPRYTDTY